MHRPRSRLLMTAVITLLALGLAACSSSSSAPSKPTGTDVSNAQQQLDFTHLVFIEPLPGFPYSQIRQNLIEIEAIEALGIDSTTFFFMQGINHPIFTCNSVGVPIPVTDSLSNNLVPAWKDGTNYQSYGIAGVAVDQPDPNGIFQGVSSGTNSLCIDSHGHQFDGYNEAFDVSVTAPAHWDTATGTIVLDGEPVYPTCRVVILDAKRQKAQEICTAPAQSLHGKKPVTVPAGPGPSASSSPSPHASARTSAMIRYRIVGVTAKGVELALAA